PTSHGLAKQLDVRIPRIETAVKIDGVLDEPAWSRAALLTGFSQYRPVDGRPAEDSTDVLAWYAPDAIYFGIRAFEPHGHVVRATLADRDNIDADDHVAILLDTYLDHRRATMFAVNPLGVQEDGVWSDGVAAGAAGGPSAGGRFDATIDLNPDYVYESRGHVTERGYEVEVRIPFKSLRYQSADPQDWGIQVLRSVQHSGYEETWTPAVRANASFLIQSGRLVGLSALRRGLVLDLTPEFTTKVDGAPTTPGYDYRGTPEVAGNLRWGLTQNLRLTATANPDFSEVQIASSWTRGPDGGRAGKLWTVTFGDRTGRAYGNHFELLGIEKSFQDTSGFVNRTDFVAGRTYNRFSWYGRPGALVEQFTAILGFAPIWRYADFGRLRRTIEDTLQTFLIANLRGGWQAQVTLSLDHFGFEAADYVGYTVGAAPFAV